MTENTMHSPDPSTSPAFERRRRLLERWEKHRGEPVAPTREAWAEDLRLLGAVDQRTARRLTENGEAHWPWIPPFEEDQLSELLGRALDSEARATLRGVISWHHGPEESESPESRVPKGDTTESTRRKPDRRRTRAAGPPPTPSDSPAPCRTDEETIGRRRELREGSPWTGSPWTLGSTRFLQALAMMAGLATMGALCVGLLLSGYPPVVSGPLGTAQHRDAPPPPLSTPHEELAQALVLLNDTLAESQRPEIREIFLRRFRPLQTLGPEEARRNSEMAQGVVELAILRSGLSWSGLVHEMPLLSAVACGWLGGEPAPECATHAPTDEVLRLTEWIEGR